MLFKFDRLGGKCRCPLPPLPEMFDQIQVQASQGHSQSGPGAPPFISRLCASGSLAGFHPGCFCSSLHSSFSLSIGFLPSPPARPDSSALMARKNPAGYKLFPLTDKLGLCAHRDLHSSRNCSAAFRRFMPPDNPVSEGCRELL